MTFRRDHQQYEQRAASLQSKKLCDDDDHKTNINNEIIFEKEIVIK